MPVRETALANARRIFAQHQGMLRTSAAIRLGIHPRTLYALRDRGEVEEVARGFYRLSEGRRSRTPIWWPLPYASREP